MIRKLPHMVKVIEGWGLWSVLPANQKRAGATSVLFDGKLPSENPEDGLTAGPGYYHYANLRGGGGGCLNG
ncbi:hypothetical protein ACG3SL_14020 [Sphingomonas sp. CJ20]